jgi:hypothetical protein
VQAADAHPDHAAHCVPLGHCESLVHQQGTPAAVHWPVGDETLSQLPIEHDHELATEAAVWQSSLSAEPLPVHVPVHWLSLLTGAGVRVVVHMVPPVPTHATELGAGMHPLPSSAPVPVHGPAGDAQLLLCELGMQWPLAHATSAKQ